MVATGTLSSKYQISIPKAVREEQHWEAGQPGSRDGPCWGKRERVLLPDDI